MVKEPAGLGEPLCFVAGRRRGRLRGEVPAAGTSLHPESQNCTLQLEDRLCGAGIVAEWVLAGGPRLVLLVVAAGTDVQWMKWEMHLKTRLEGVHLKGNPSPPDGGEDKTHLNKERTC